MTAGSYPHPLPLPQMKRYAKRIRRTIAQFWLLSFVLLAGPAARAAIDTSMDQTVWMMLYGVTQAEAADIIFAHLRDPSDPETRRRQ